MIFQDENDTPRISMNGRQKLFICMIDLCIIVELCLAMSKATTVGPDLFTPTFMKVFFAMFLPTLVVGFAGFRKLRNQTEKA